MSYNETLTLTPEFGLEESIEFRTLKTEMEDGSLRTRAKRNYGMRKYMVNVLFYSKTSMDALWDFYIARQGRYDPFLIKIYHEYQVTDEAIATGNSSNKVFVLDEFPVDTTEGTFTIYVDDIDITSHTTLQNNFLGEYSTMTIDIAPGEVAITGDYEIYFYMRFAKDIMKRELFNYNLLNAGVELIEASWIDYRPRGSNESLIIISVSDSISISDVFDSVKGTGIVSTYNTISISTYVNITISKLVDISDSITISEYTEIYYTKIGLYISDSISISENIDMHPSIIFVTISDSISISENSDSYAPILGVDINDSITVTPYKLVFPFYDPSWDVEYFAYNDYEPDNANQVNLWTKIESGTSNINVKDDVDCLNSKKLDISTRSGLTDTAYYSHTTGSYWADNVDNSAGYDIEARVKVRKSDSNSCQSILVKDGDYHFILRFSDELVFIPNAYVTAGGDLSYAIDMTDEYVVLKINVSGTAVTVYINGTLRISGTLNLIVTTPIELFWGDTSSVDGNNGETDWDYIRYICN